MKIIRTAKINDVKLSKEVMAKSSQYKNSVNKTIKELHDEFNKGFAGKDFNSANVKTKANALILLAKVLST